MDSTSSRHTDDLALRRVFGTLGIYALALVAGACFVFGSSLRDHIMGMMLVLDTAAAGALYRWSMSRLWRTANLPDDAGGAVVSELEVRSSMAEIEPIDAQAAIQFLLAISEPKSTFLRLAEVITPLTRSTDITSTFTVRLPRDLTTSVTPLTRRRRGVVDEGLQISVEGGPGLAALPRNEVIAFAVLSMREVIRTIGRRAAHEYDLIVPELIAEFCKGEPATADRTAALVAKIENLATADDQRIETVARVVRAMAFYEFHCVATDAIGQPALHRDADLASYETPAATTAPLSRLLRFTVRRRLIFIFNRSPSRQQRTLARLRTVFGIPAASVYVQLDNAARAQSYHAELSGPEHSYLVRQAIYNDKNVPASPPGGVSTLPRLGQRHAHLYLRTRAPLTDWVYCATFFERTPTALAPVAVSSAALAALCGIGLVTLTLGNLSMLVGGPALALALIGVPSSISAWSGVQNARTGNPGGLLARLGTLLTITLAVSAAIVDLEVSTPQAWLAITWLAAVHATFFITAWFAQAAVLHSFVYRDPSSPERTPVV